MSKLIELWKEDGTYEEGLKLLNLYAPNHQLLMQLEKGESAINKLYLKKALEGVKLPSRPIKENEAEWLNHRLKELYQLKAKTRNQYHKVSTRTARIRINRELIEFRKEIHQLWRQLEYYNNTGELPIIPDPDQLILPSTLLELYAEQLRVRPNLSKAQKKLRQAYKDKATKRIISKLEKKVQDLTTKKKAIEQRIIILRNQETE